MLDSRSAGMMVVARGALTVNTFKRLNDAINQLVLLLLVWKCVGPGLTTDNDNDNELIMN